ncbi:MAG: hypothetical protein EP344_16620 [Bacteroidetes bacterium]|nr:MAG: hypothetical protein EP344_16620 [Bacteroidota bacterium]
MCDTLVALSSATEDGSVILAKNSDREANEMQALEYHPGAVHGTGQQLRCTYIDIDQADITHAVLISRPFWMWGAEMGINEKGVAIGNEAIWTKMPVHKKNDRLLGMDLLRLALERAGSARHGVEVICDLLERYGQGGIAGYQDKSMAYHNSFLLADNNEAWVLETADHLWVAKKVEHYYSISNGATIGEEFDLAHPDLISTAVKNSWHRRGKTFNFRESYSDWFYTTFSASKKRRWQSHCYLRDHVKKVNVAGAIKALQSHDRDDYAPQNPLLGSSVCAHAGNPLSRHATQTTGSMVAHLADKPTAWFTATSSACTSVFKPLWFGENVLPPLGPPGPGFDPGNYWWKNELLHRTILRDYRGLKPRIASELEQLQFAILTGAQNLVEDDYFAYSAEAFTEAARKTGEWLGMLNTQPIKARGNWLYRHYWNRLNREAGLVV